MGSHYAGYFYFHNWQEIDEEIERNAREYRKFIILRSIIARHFLDPIFFNCRDFNVLCLEVMKPSKMQQGLQALEDVNVYVLVIRSLIEHKATSFCLLTSGMILAYVADFIIIQCEYIYLSRNHFHKKMTKIEDLDFLVDDSLPGMTCYTEAGENTGI